MSNSFVPKIKMSKGTSKKTKFDVSCNTHTTSEVGYLQPTFSKLLMPNSDLSIKCNDSILMSSLVVPTFGELSLRHWFMATPVSSLWTPLGSFLSGRACVDSDASTGYSIPRQMPRASVSTLIYHLIGSQYITQNYSFHNTPELLNGNVCYAFHRSGSIRSNQLLEFDDLIPSSYKKSLENFGADQTPYDSNLVGFWRQICAQTRYYLNIDDENYDSEGARSSLNLCPVSQINKVKRLSPVFPWWFQGIVVKNTDSLRSYFIHKVVADGEIVHNTSFPSPSECPYVLIRFNSLSVPLLASSAYLVGAVNHSPLVGITYSSCFEAIPFTMRMFQGDTSFDLYNYGWRNKFELFTFPNNIFYANHPTGNSDGWRLMDDDAYFTGDLSTSKFDYSCIQRQPHSGGGETIADSSIKFYCCGTWSRRFKRLRKLFIGLGQQFNPFDVEQMTPWKYFSYYKSWFDNFYPKRDIQYYQTPLARLTNFLSYHSSTWIDDYIEGIIGVNNISAISYSYEDMENISFYFDLMDLLYACADAKYLMPMDYFTLADPHPLDTASDFDAQDNNLSADVAVNAPSGGQLPTPSDKQSDGIVSYNSSFLPDSSSTMNGWAIKMAEKMLTYLTKRRVVGKSVSDTMRALFGAVDEHDKAHESTWCFGTSSTKIKISAVMSQSETEEMHLGDFAGRGLGGSSSKTFKIDNNADLLVVIVMSALVPRLGYYQGDMRENSVGLSPKEFCRPIYDAVGYDDVYASEYIADVCHYDNNHQLAVDPYNRTMNEINGRILGLVPRYSWYKVARDCVNGDISLPTTKDSMSPYVLTRDVSNRFTLDPLEMRTIRPDSFNKIFNESSSLDDHFILQMGFDVNLFAPLKSLSTSFEDFDTDEDGTIEVEHS